jgi:hypothetical protein
LIVQLLKLQYHHLKRDLGIWFIVLSVGAFFISQFIAAISQQHCLGVLGSALFLIYTYHVNRKDLNFVHRYLKDPKQQLAIGYNLLLLPVTLALVFNGYYFHVLAGHALVSSFSFFNIQISSTKLFFISKYIPAAQFEWISGIRKNFYLLIILFLLALILSPVKLFGIVPLLLINSVFLGFYNYFEPLVMLNPENLSPETFLTRKINFFRNVLFTANGPVLLINSILNPESAWFNVFFLFAFLIFASCSVYIKYSKYEPNGSLTASIDFLILFASLFFPYLIPLSIIIYFSSRKKAVERLKEF